MFSCPATEDFFRARLDHMIDLRHPLCVLSCRMPWQQIEASVSHLFMRKARASVAMPDLDLFGEAPVAVARASNAGRPRVPLRMMIALLYLKHAFNESDEGVVERWGETPTWQFFSGQAHFEHRRPCDATTLVKFRKLLGDEGVEELLAQTINAAVEMKLIAKSDLERVIVDSTVQQKAVAHPTDSRLLEKARDKLVQAAKDAGIALKQTFVKEGKQLSHKAGRYAHAKQWRRMHKAIGRQRTVLGRLAREVERKANGQNSITTLHTAHHTPIAAAVQRALSTTLERAQRIWAQTAAKKNREGKGKLYAFHAPEVECIGKVRREVAYIIVSPAHKVGDETGRSVGRSLPVHALLATAACEATGITYRAFGPRRLPRGSGVTCQHHGGWDARLSGMVNRSELLQASLCITSQRC